MTKECKIISLASYRAEPVGPFNPSKFLLDCEVDGDGNLTFAHVLNVQRPEGIWPGEAAELFFPKLFACWMSGDTLYVLDNYVHEHMRCETLRLCDYGRSSLDDLKLGLSIYLGMKASEDRYKTDYYTGGSFPAVSGDGCEDVLFIDYDDEPDTLNSELLLTEVYIGPEKLTAPDSVRKQTFNEYLEESEILHRTLRKPKDI